MSEKKYTVFISSTFKDLIEERRAIARAVVDIGHIPASMENFPAMDEEQFSYIKRVIDECDYYVLIIAGKYGSMDKSGKSYTQLEYEYAKSKGIPVLGFPVKDISQLKRDQTETDQKTIAKLEAFRNDVMDGRVIKLWEDRKDLELALVKSLPEAIRTYPRTGWIRTPKNSSEDLLDQINDLRNENEKLKQEILNLSTEAKPLFENLPGLDDSTDLGISHYKHLYRSMGKTDTAFKMSWRQLILIFCMALQVSKTRDNAKQAVADQLLSVQIYGGRDAPDDIIAELDNIFFERIAAQLMALGYLDEGEHNQLFMTKAAKHFYLNSMVKRTT